MSVAQNTVNNMMEDATMLVMYSTVNKFIHDQLASWFPPEIDEQGREKMNVALEVLSGGASFLFTSSMMELIRKQEIFTRYVFGAGEALIAVLYARNQGYVQKMFDKMKNIKGVKAISKFKIFSAQHDHQNSFVSQVYQAMQTILQSDTNNRDVAQTVQASNGSMDTALNRERLNFQMAQAQNNNFNKSLMLKMVTGNFTTADKLMLQKVIGRTDFQSVPLNVDELNKVRDFMFVKDNQGNIIGLSEALFSFINGLGFITRK